MKITVRKEEEKDYRLVEEITREAFWNLQVPGCTEHYIVHKIRNTEDGIEDLNYVAEVDGNVVGSIFYTKSSIVNIFGNIENVVTFGPVSVHPDYQKIGVGSMLIRHTIEIVRSLGYKAIVIYGDPRYYYRFGFRSSEIYEISAADGKYATCLLALSLVDNSLKDVEGCFEESKVFEIDDFEFSEFDKTFPYKEQKVTESQKEYDILCSLRF